MTLSVPPRSLNKTTPSIYVACLAAYNNGKLHGTWIDCCQPAEDIDAEIQRMLESSPEPDAEEWAIHDFEGFGSWKPGESESIDTIAEVAEMIEEHGPVFADLMANFHGDLKSAKYHMERSYMGCFNSMQDYAEQFMKDCGDLDSIPEHLHAYFDFEAYARDLERDGHIFVIETGHLQQVHVFTNE